MPKTKVTFEYEATVGVGETSGSKQGWSESWYNPTDATADGARFSALLLMNKRIKLLTPGWTITSIRIANLDAANNLTRKGQLVFVPPLTGRGTYPGTKQDEQPYDALEVRIDTEPGNHRSFSMRGIPNEIVNAGARFLNPAAWEPRFADWASELNGTAGDFLGNHWAIRVRGTPFTFNIRNVIILPATNPDASPSHPVVTLNGNLGLAAGQTITISGVMGMTRINGQWIIGSVPVVGGAVDPYVVLKAKRRTAVGGVYTTGGTAVTFGYSLAPITNATPGYGTSRRTGRPSGVVRGRRSNRG